jgi:hypothetical protein
MNLELHLTTRTLSVAYPINPYTTLVPAFLSLLLAGTEFGQLDRTKRLCQGKRDHERAG